MPPSSKFRKLTAAEKAIGKRIAAYRRFKLWHQYDLAAQIGISRDQLASFEIGRVALTTRAAIMIADELHLSLLWLAEGVGQNNRFLELPADIKEKALEHRCFLDAWRSALHDYFYRDWKFVTERHRGGNYTPDDVRIERWIEAPKQKQNEFSERLVSQLYLDLEEAFSGLSVDGKQRLFECVDEALRGYLEDWNNEHPGQKIKPLQKNDLTGDSLKSKNGDVKSEVQKLIERVKRKAARPGAKADLARELKVAPARITEWLSGKKEPGGDYALRLQKWVESPTHQ